MCSSGQRAEHREAVTSACRLSENDVIQDDSRVGCEDRERLAFLTNGERLFTRHPRDIFASPFIGSHRFINVSAGHSVWHADLRQQLVPARGHGRQTKYGGI